MGVRLKLQGVFEKRPLRLYTLICFLLDTTSRTDRSKFVEAATSTAAFTESVFFVSWDDAERLPFYRPFTEAEAV